MATLSNSFEGGTNGVAISTSNSGGASGDAFDDVTFGGVGTVNYTTGSAYTGGSLGAEINPDTSFTAYCGWTLTATADNYGRMYVRFPTLPTGLVMLVAFRDNGSAANRGRLTVQTDGRIRLVNAAGTTVATTPNDATGKLVANSWARLEWHFIGSASGSIELKMFLAPQATSPDSTTNTGSTGTVGAIDRLRVGQATTTAVDLAAFHIDNVKFDTVAYPGPVSSSATFIDPVDLLDVVPSLFTPALAQTVHFDAILDAVAGVLEPGGVGKGIHFDAILDASASVITPGQVKMVVTGGGGFQDGAFQDDAFQVGTGLFVTAEPLLLTPGITATPTSIYMPSPAATDGAFQTDTFQDNAFQMDRVGSGADMSPVLFTPSLGAASNAQTVSLATGAGWDSADIFWDDPDHVWDEGNVGGIILATPQLFTPTTVTEKVTVPLLDAVPVLYTPNANPSSVLMGLITATPAVFMPSVKQVVVVGLLDATPEVLEFSIAAPLEPPLIDASPELFTPNVNPITIEDVPLIDHTPGLFTPMPSEQVTVPLLDAIPVIYTPFVGPVIAPELIDHSPVVYDPNLTPIRPDLLDATPEIFEPQKVNVPVPQTVRLDDSVEQFCDASPVIFAPDSVELAPPQTITVGTFIDGTPLVMTPFVVLPTRPTIVLHARYDPVTTLHARYDPVILKHAQNTRQGS